MGPMMSEKFSFLSKWFNMLYAIRMYIQHTTACNSCTEMAYLQKRTVILCTHNQWLLCKKILKDVETSLFFKNYHVITNCRQQSTRLLFKSILIDGLLLLSQSALCLHMWCKVRQNQKYTMCEMGKLDI